MTNGCYHITRKNVWAIRWNLLWTYRIPCGPNGKVSCIKFMKWTSSSFKLIYFYRIFMYFEEHFIVSRFTLSRIFRLIRKTFHIKALYMIHMQYHRFFVRCNRICMYKYVHTAHCTYCTCTFYLINSMKRICIYALYTMHMCLWNNKSADPIV